MFVIGPLPSSSIRGVQRFWSAAVRDRWSFATSTGPSRGSCTSGRGNRGTGFGGRRGGSLVVVPPLVVPIDVSVLQGRFGLTRIQAEVARSFAARKSVAEIARERGRSENTVACHVREVDRKLGVRRRVELMSRLAWRRGSIPPLS